MVAAGEARAAAARHPRPPHRVAVAALVLAAQPPQRPRRAAAVVAGAPKSGQQAPHRRHRPLAGHGSVPGHMELRRQTHRLAASKA
eukprot:scaffold39202_cov55-Phaeocystis_antarctica.AAC.2